MESTRCLWVSNLYSTKTFLYLIQIVLLIGDDSDLRQAGGFLWVIRFPPPTKLTSRYNWNIVESAVTHNKPNHFSQLAQQVGTFPESMNTTCYAKTYRNTHTDIHGKKVQIWYILIDKRQRQPKEQSGMDNPETLATLGKQGNGTQTKTHTHDQENIKWAKRTRQNPMVNPGSREG